MHLRLIPSAPSCASCSEVFCLSDGAGMAFVRAQMRLPALWVQDGPSVRETGRSWFAGGSDLVWVMRLNHPRDVLIAAEEALSCGALASVVAEVHGAPSALSFTATRRLAVRAEATGGRLWLIRHGAGPEASAMRDRWRISALPSALNPDDPQAPGDPRWRAELFRSRDARPGLWEVRHDAKGDLHFTPLLPDGEVAAPPGADRYLAAR